MRDGPFRARLVCLSGVQTQQLYTQDVFRSRRVPGRWERQASGFRLREGPQGGLVYSGPICLHTFMDVHVALLCDLGNGIAIHRELGRFASIGTLENSIELAVHKNIGITADGRGEVSVDGDVKSVVAVFGDV